MAKLYDILLNKNKIGTTELEKADAPMGVVFGRINFFNITSGYSFFKDYCSKNKLKFTDYPNEKLISTLNIPGLQVFDASRIEIKGIACSISGMDSDCFEIDIVGIAYPFYEEEFPHHVKTYTNMFKRK